MKWRNVGLAMGVVVALGAALSLPSCGHDQKLVSITVSPSTVTYLSPTAAPAVFKAYGTYIHPPETKDISGQVSWATDVPDLLSLSYQAGTGEVVGPAQNVICGIADLSATGSEGTGGSGNILVGYATLTIDGTGPNCPGAATNGELVVTPAGTGTGTVSSSPPGINCPGTACGALFSPPNNIVVLTATPAANTTIAWTDCPSPNGNQCTVTVPAGGFVNIIATFTPQ